MALDRRYDIDWLRVIAIGLLLIYHIAIAFQPWGVFIGFIQSDQPMEWIWIPMAMLNVWRIPLLFFVSGMGVYFAMRKRSMKELITERSKRILIPFLFGTVCIVPLQFLIWQNYYNQDGTYILNPAHLWFLGNIFIYVLVLAPAFYYLKKNPEGKFFKISSAILGHPIGVLVLIIPLLLETLIVNPENFEMYAQTMHGFWLGLIAFASGFLCVYGGSKFWENVRKWKWIYLGIALSFYATRLLVFELAPPSSMLPIESVFWILFVFGFGYQYLNRSSNSLSYLSQAAYPIYILHMLFQYAASYLYFPLEVSVGTKLWLVLIFTYSCSFICYEFLIRRISVLRPLFGLKRKTVLDNEPTLKTELKQHIG